MERETSIEKYFGSVLALAVLVCGLQAGATGVTASKLTSASPDEVIAQHFAAQLASCFASHVRQRVTRDSSGAIVGLSRSCAALPASMGDPPRSSFASEYAELLVDPSMDGVNFRVRHASMRTTTDGTRRVEIEVRYFRSNGAPYEINASLQPAVGTRLGWVPMASSIRAVQVSPR